jgi:GNAT superfamily N-acetyltransferase
MTNYSIRHAIPQTDGEALLSLARAAVDEAQGPYSTRRSGSDIFPSAFNSSIVFVAEDIEERQLIGFVTLGIADIPDMPQSHAERCDNVTMLGVVPERRRQGIARTLVQRALQGLTGKIAPGNHWAIKLRDLLSEHPAIPCASIGFPADWRSRKIWGL